jgi:predicted Rossmann-fold nucleotide-binding protein
MASPFDGECGRHPDRAIATLATRPHRLVALPSFPRPEPFDPLRHGLYTGDELMQGYTTSDPDGALDRTIARYFVAAGGRNPPSAAEAIAQRLHDFGIDRALTAWLDGDGGVAPKVVGVMGSHATPRNDPQYAVVADLGRRLARAGFLVATGGGPGLMEAANLGAYLSTYADRGAVDRALALLKAAPAYEADHVRYIEATRRVLADLPNGGRSLGVPTWVYPDEPVNLFSSHIAKYFSNSMREEGLIAVGSHGVVIASDTPGTVREVFQAAEQNSYWVGDHRTPMVLLGPEGSASFELLMAYARRDGYADLVRSIDDPGEVVDFIVRTPPLTRQPPAAKRPGAGMRRTSYRRPS